MSRNINLRNHIHTIFHAQTLQVGEFFLGIRTDVYKRQGAYHDVPMGPLQHPGAERDTFIGLSKESSEIGRKIGITYAEEDVYKRQP